ncbi:MAG: hypothetical protein JWP74_1120 [Marmoricola sp.]|nr:hypothetical protein [Marmoricola sp.]
MEDEAYVEQLLTILTNPHPTGIDPQEPYGMADDRIDRHDGFGSQCWVEALSVAAGEHGDELVVAFAHTVPSAREWSQVPTVGTVSVPFDLEWRELSGYEEPAAYAPVVARAVFWASRSMAQRHGPERDSPVVDGDARAPVLSREGQWQILLDALGREGIVRTVAPGRLELVVPESHTEVVTVVVTPEQWEGVLECNPVNHLDLYFADLLGPRGEDEPFVVHFQGDLVRSTREKLPPVRGRQTERKFAEIRARRPDATMLGWYANPPE